MTGAHGWVAVDDAAAAAWARMADGGLRHLPVLADGVVVGVVGDLAAAQAPAGARVGAVMGPATTVDAEAPFDVMLARLVHTQSGCVVQVDGDGRLRGVVTELDAVARAAEVLPASVVVEDVASTSLHTCRRDTTVAQALAQMRHAWVRHLVVCDGGRLAGVVSHRDLLRAAPESAVGERLRGTLQFTVGWRTTLREAAAQLHRQGIGSLPVVDAADPLRVQAIVTRTDVLRALGSRVGPGVGNG